MLLLKHVRNWSYEVLEREVRANLVYRSFCRIGLEKVPDAKTLVRLGQAVGPEVISELHARIVVLAQAKAALVQTGATLAHRIRGQNQRAQETPRTKPLPLSRH
jgi:hypothetical protein